jgi:hypothetical protein
MYRLANRLDPDSYYRLARAAFAEMVAAGANPGFNGGVDKG